MTPSSLPKQAFLPKRKLSEQERQAFVDRRERLFQLCTPAEQQCLVDLARWHASYGVKILGKPNIFTESAVARFYSRYFPWAASKSNALVRGLAKVSDIISRIERWRGLRGESLFIAHMHSRVGVGAQDVLIGVIQYLRLLPLEMASRERRSFDRKLNAATRDCVAGKHVPATKRFDAVQRCVRWTYEAFGPGASTSDLRVHIWTLLLEVAHEDIQACVRLVDEHWNQTRPPQILMSLHLREAPELAYQLAVRLKEHRVEFAVDMLGTSIRHASYQLNRLEPPAIAAMEMVMDASCRLLADWTFERCKTGSPSVLLAMDSLLRFGNPADSYWQRIPQECLPVIKGMEPSEQDQQLRLLAQLVFYGDSPAALTREAHELFKACVARRVGGPLGSRASQEQTVSDVCQALSILEDKVLSFRNRRIAASPDHPLLHTVEEMIQLFLERLQASEPAEPLGQVVLVMLSLSNQALIRKYHRILRETFAVQARKFPADAGRALKQMIQYCGYSQTDDETYRKELCQESFNALLPVLEAISPPDAAVARTGIGWSPRGWNL